MIATLDQIVADFAAAMRAADAGQPIAVSARGDREYKPGIGPHTEDEVVRMCIDQMAGQHPARYPHQRGVSYASNARAKCDLCIGQPPIWDWAIEAKLLRFLGDNGLPNDNMLMHILSPYPQHHSALTDCSKLAASPIAARKAVLIFGYPHAKWPLEPAIEAFELLARRQVQIGDRASADSGALVHPVHNQARVFGWEIAPLASAS